MKRFFLTAISIMLAAIFAVSTFYIVNYCKNANKENKVFESVKTEFEQRTEETETDNPLASLFSKNNDLIGWIRIDDTHIDYPVMNSEYYLRRNFNKEYSMYGTPFVMNGISDNTIIYGHNMRDSSMFHDLTKYEDRAFYEEHKIVHFTTLETDNLYEIICVFKTMVYSSNGFYYYDYSTFNSEGKLNEYWLKCKALELYNTGLTAEYGDKLITLSTCEYSRNNGRMVVVAKKI